MGAFIVLAVIVLGIWLVVSALWALIFMLLWNFALVGAFPTVFPQISFWVAYGLTLLISMVFGGIKRSK